MSSAPSRNRAAELEKSTHLKIVCKLQNFKWNRIHFTTQKESVNAGGVSVTYRTISVLWYVAKERKMITEFAALCRMFNCCVISILQEVGFGLGVLLLGDDCGIRECQVYETALSAVGAVCKQQGGLLRWGRRTEHASWPVAQSTSSWWKVGATGWESLRQFTSLALLLDDGGLSEAHRDHSLAQDDVKDVYEMVSTVSEHSLVCCLDL